MRLLRLSCTISIFLCAAFSARAQALEAVECERVLFEGASPAVANAALLSRAEFLIELARYDEALDALDRLRLYALTEEEHVRSGRMRALAQYRMGDYASAAASLGPDVAEPSILAVLTLASVGRFDEALAVAIALRPDREEDLRILFRDAPNPRSEGLATMLSMLPPLGHLYIGDSAWPGVTVLSYAGAALTVWQFLEGNWVNAILGGGMLLNASYMEHNIATVPERTAAFNSERLSRFLSRLEAML